jgi:hypothetical protein
MATAHKRSVSTAITAAIPATMTTMRKTKATERVAMYPPASAGGPLTASKPAATARRRWTRVRKPQPNVAAVSSFLAVGLWVRQCPLGAYSPRWPPKRDRGRRRVAGAVGQVPRPPAHRGDDPARVRCPSEDGPGDARRRDDRAYSRRLQPRDTHNARRGCVDDGARPRRLRGYGGGTNWCRGRDLNSHGLAPSGV